MKGEIYKMVAYEWDNGIPNEEIERQVMTDFEVVAVLASRIYAARFQAWSHEAIAEREPWDKSWAAEESVREAKLILQAAEKLERGEL